MIRVSLPKVYTGPPWGQSRTISIYRDGQLIFNSCTERREIIPVKAQIGAIIRVEKKYKDSVDWEQRVTVDKEDQVISFEYDGKRII